MNTVSVLQSDRNAYLQRHEFSIIDNHISCLPRANTVYQISFIALLPLHLQSASQQANRQRLPLWNKFPKHLQTAVGSRTREHSATNIIAIRDMIQHTHRILTVWSVFLFSAISKASSSSSSALRLSRKIPFISSRRARSIKNLWKNSYCTSTSCCSRKLESFGQCSFLPYNIVVSFCHTFSTLPLCRRLGIAIGKLVQKGAKAKSRSGSPMYSAFPAANLRTDG